MHKFSWIAVGSTVLALSACGGGGGGGDSSGTVAPALVTASGVVIDGTLANATVFLDLNGNGIQDSGEPSTTTGANGAFSLQATASQLSSISIIALATAGTTTDSDNPGKTIAANFSLIAPPGSYQVISPITSLVVANIQSTGSVSAAASAVAATLNIPISALYENYVAAGHTSVHNIAAAVTQAIASVQSQSTVATSLAAQYQSLNTVVANHIVPNLTRIESASSPAAAAALAVHDIKSIYSLGGSLTGLHSAGLVLANGTGTVALAANAASFNFSNLLEGGDSYNVTVLAQPASQTCTVSNGSGQIANASTSAVRVNCVDNAQMRLINASAGYNLLDMTVNNASVSTGIAYGAAGSYTSVDTTLSATQVTSGGTTVIQTTPSLAGNSKYSLIVYGFPNAMRTALLQEFEPAPAATYAKLLVLNLAPDVGALNVYLTAAAPMTGAAPFTNPVQGGSGSGYLQASSGTYHVRVTGSASTDVNTDVRMDFDGLVLDSTTVNTLIITPTAGGVLVNAISVIQAGAVKAYGGTNARIRVIDSVVGAPGTDVAVVASRAGTTLLNSGSAAPVGYYTIVPATNDAISLTLNGVPMASPTPALAAGSDYTVLVWGTLSAPQVTVIADDNRLPLAGYAKLRLLNGAANGLTQTMTLDYSLIAANVVPGTASVPVQVLAGTGTSSLLAINASNSVTPVFLQSPFNIQNQGVYTVYMLGNSTVPGNLVGFVNKDR